MNNNILITGGAGFIGSHLVRLLVKKYPNYHIVNVDVLTYAGNLENLNDIKDKDNYTFIKCDICDFKKVKQIFTDYNKLVITKDAAGVITNYRLTAAASFKVNYNDKLETITIDEKFDIKKGDSLFEEKNYENLIKQDIANLIVQKFIFQLLKTK